MLGLAHRVLSIDDKRDRELPCHLWRPARRPAARPPISIARAVGRASGPPPRAARSDARRLEAARAIDESTFWAQMLATADGTSLRCRHSGRAAKPATRAAAPNQALHVGTGGVAGRGGAAECQLHCRSARIVFSQSAISEMRASVLPLPPCAPPCRTRADFHCASRRKGFGAAAPRRQKRCKALRSGASHR